MGAQNSGLRKAAILVVTLGEEAGAQVVRHLGEDEVAALAAEIAGLPAVTADVAESVVREFQQMAAASLKGGGPEYAARVLRQAFGPDSAGRFLPQAPGGPPSAMASLERIDPRQLAGLLRDEHPQTTALLLAHLPPPAAARLLAALPAEVRAEALARMARLEEASPEIVGCITGVIGRKLESAATSAARPCGGVAATVELLNRLEPAVAEELLGLLNQRDTALADAIRRRMFVFEDFLSLGTDALRALLGKVDRKQLTVALKGTSESLKKHFTQGMSQRGAEMLREDMEALGPVRIRDVETAQQEIITLARQLEAEGVISLRRSGSEEYVV